MILPGKIVSLGTITPNAVAVKAYQRALRASRDHEAYDKKYPPYEWARKTYVMQRLIKENSILDVGIGRGYFINMLRWSRRYERVHGIDIIKHNNSKFAENVVVEQGSVTALPFADKEFDCVTCMEVLEHLQDDQVGVAIAQLRRVAKKQLIVSVPFDEPRPLPAYHHQHFDIERLKTLFPSAKFSLLLKPKLGRVPWMLVEERYD